MSKIPSQSDVSLSPDAVGKHPDRETTWNEGFSAGWKAAKEGPPGYRERLSAVSTFKVVDLAKHMHDAILAASTGQGVDDATLIASLIISLGNFLPGSLDPAHRDQWVQQFTAGLPVFVAMCAKDGPNALRRERGDYGYLRLITGAETQLLETETENEVSLQ